ncbi:MAG: hypothetical protein MHM6MM_000989 [Cercozoa sp. M6MM]
MDSHLDVSSDGALVVVAHNTTFQVLDAATREVLFSSVAGVPTKQGAAQDAPQGHSAPIRVIAFSPCGTLLVTSGDDKLLCVWERQGNEWTIKCHRRIDKKAACVTWLADSSGVVVGDKFGDVQTVLLEDVARLRRVFGHLSVVTDVCFVGDKLVTCDRDEKVRVSRYPRTFVASRYLMQHEEFVAALLPLSDSVVVSVGGDAQLCLWNVADGTLLHCHALELDGTRVMPVRAAVDKETGRVAVLTSTGKVLCVHIQHDSKSGQYAVQPIALDVSVAVSGLRFHPKTHELLVVSASPRLSAYDVSQNKLAWTCDDEALKQNVDDGIQVFWKHYPHAVDLPQRKASQARRDRKRLKGESGDSASTGTSTE